MRKKNISFNIRCSPEWLAQKKQAADANEMTVSDYIRKAADIGDAFLYEENRVISQTDTED